MLYISIACNCLLIQKKLVAHFENDKEINFLTNATNGHELILDLQSKSVLPDIIFMGIHMPVMDGIATTYFLRLHYPSIKVICLSIYDDLNILKQAIECGVQGFILKKALETVLDVAIQKIHNGEKYLDYRIGLSDDENHKILAINETHTNNQLFNITSRERTFIIFNATALTYEQIAKIMFVEAKTIHTYFGRVSKKFNLTNRNSLTLFSLQHGLAKVAKYQ